MHDPRDESRTLTNFNVFFNLFVVCLHVSLFGMYSGRFP